MKSRLKLPREPIEALRPGDVRLYLTSRGWLPRPDGSSPKPVEFHNPAYPDVELSVRGTFVQYSWNSFAEKAGVFSVKAMTRRRQAA